jgi:tetraacyldisaccharide 4'-kinase
LLLPLSGIYWLLSTLRRLLYRSGFLKTHRVSVPVIVVGNITAGGTGKTPTVIWLVNALRAKGFAPGIISRGYGGSHSGTSMRVDADSDAAVVGDEPVLLARRAKCPVVVDWDRVRAANMLIDDGVDVVVADDGLQHLRLERDYEICVIDGMRGLGNRRLLPAGPLRESVRRLGAVDQVLVNGGSDRENPQACTAEQNAIEFELKANDACRLNGSLARKLDRFSATTVHAFAGIGNPQRFFDLLRAEGLQLIEHRFADHAAISQSDLEMSDPFDVFMTEKDAVKVGWRLPDKYWYVPVELSMDPVDSAPLVEQIESRLRDCRRSA